VSCGFCGFPSCGFILRFHRPRVNATGENTAKVQDARFNPRFAVFEAFAQIFIKAAQPRTAHAAVDAVIRACMGWVDELAAGLGHGRSLDARVVLGDRFGLRVGSEFSEMLVRRFLWRVRRFLSEECVSGASWRPVLPGAS
jgi:hypothetical protein